ncbi:sensor histidine kinase [Desulfotignum phosphitoxidans]|jgi:signal transduction histidine kinase|uniref:histidine kinase n=1 Tax=Desulfotignum phosphitoxidans DSM 13687 TaxID=1286635 RepID=S0G4H3_9BACT|nr:PAS domain-containing sensor histidine kinase [Desulfotignum phosphitoxidans]EMS79232.1 integral membrane sensor signal transduction histidine kinase ZraS [Desulfotignum phosphitoxidans DSM 13687]
MIRTPQMLQKQEWLAFLFHRHNAHLASFHTFSNYPRIWIISIIILAVTSLSPLVMATFINNRLIHKSVDSELVLQTDRVTSNAKRSVRFFLEERLNALRFVVNELPYYSLIDNEHLTKILINLKLGFGGFTDLSIIDSDGSQVAYAGPFNLEGKNYKTQSWFKQSMEKDNFISEVFTGYRDVPHIIIAVRSQNAYGRYYLLRATLDTQRLMDTVLSYKSNFHTDIFLINHTGILQTPSTNYGKIFTPTQIDIPAFSDTTQVITPENNKDKSYVVGYSYIATEAVTTPFILMVHKKKSEVMGTWLNLGKTFNWIIGFCCLVMMVIITLVSTYMVNQLFLADQSKAETMLKMEQSQQLACIGQLSAGIAHEINNPLALINETTGYLKDLYHYKDTPRDDKEIIELLNDILEAVSRCGTITSQLLGFVRQFDVQISSVNVEQLITGILSFHKKETEYKGIHVTTAIAPDVPDIKTDRGKLQQILLNLINNAFQAIEVNGCLDITVSHLPPNTISIEIKDTGCGISEENLQRIHEPFFSTKKERKGTGLGLSITYGLVKKLQGSIRVESSEGVGTIFTVTLPVKLQKEDEA